MIDYFLSFSNQAAAIADPIAGQFYSSDASDWRRDVCFTFVKATVGPTVPIDVGWHIIIAQTNGNTNLDFHPNLKIAYSRNTGIKTSPSIVLGQLTQIKMSPVPMGSDFNI